MKKRIVSIIIIITILMLIPFLILMMPIKYVATNLELNNEPQELLSEGETKQIYACVTPTIPSPAWHVYGKDGVLFNSEKSKFEGILVSGNFPKKISYDLIPGTIFILNGRYYVKKNYGDFDAIGCFEVESWSVLGSLKRDEHKYLSKSSLTIRDYLAADVIPISD